MRKRLLIVAYIFLFTLPLASAEPWWNSSWNYRKQVNITNNNLSQTLEQGYTVNATFNHSQLVSAGKSVANGSDVRALWYDSTSWWNSSWNYRKKITITNNNASQVLEQNYTINLTLNTNELVSGAKMNATGNDTRIVWWNGTSNVELDRILEPSSAGGFDGSNDYVGVSNSFNYGEGSFVLWIKPLLTANDFFGNLYSWSTQGSRKLRFTSNKIEFYIDPAGAGGTYGVTSTDSLSANQWYFIVATWNDTSGISRIYINGTLQGTGTAGGIGTPGSTFIIGAGGGSGTLDSYFNGIIDEAFIFNRSLNATEISDLYNKRRPLDSTWFNTTGLVGLWHFDNTTSTSVRESSGNNNHGTQTNGAYYTSGFIVPDTYKLNTLWFKLQKNISANSWDDNYYVYYGNPSAGAAPANGSKVFLFYDDFEDGDYTNNPTWGVTSGSFSATNKYLLSGTSSGDYIHANFSSKATQIKTTYETKNIVSPNMVSVSFSNGTSTGTQGGCSANEYAYAVNHHSSVVNDIEIYKCINSVYSELAETSMTPQNIWYSIDYIINNTGIYYFVDGVLKISSTDTTFRGFSSIALESNALQRQWDNFKIRKYLSPEPSASLGTEQGQSRYVELDRVNTTAFNNTAANTVLWFKTQANIPAGSSDVNYTLYYGNPSAGVAPANGSNVYLFYDDFEGTSLDTSKWLQGTGTTITMGSGVINVSANTNYGGINSTTEFGVPYVLESRAKFINYKAWVGFANDVATAYIMFYHGGPTGQCQDTRYTATDSCSGGVKTDISSIVSANTFYDFKIIREINSQKFYVNGSLVASNAATCNQNLPAKILGYECVSNKITVDNIKLRKYLSPEPSAALGAEEDNIPPQITISSPLNTTYSTTSVWLNYSVNESSLDWVGYSLDGASNVTTNTNTGEIDVEASYSCSGPFRDVRPCSNAVDENWVTFAGPEAGSTASVIENFSVKNYENPKGIIFTYRFAASGTYRYDLSIYDFSSSVWKLLASWTGQDFSTKNTSTITQNITNYIRDNVISFKSDAIDFGASYTVVYSEGKVTLINYTNTSIPLTSLSEGSHNIVVSANDTAGNLNSSRVFFTVDTTSPTITIQSPSNTTYATTNIWANVTLNETGSWCGRNLDSGSNVTLTNSSGNWNNLMSISDGSHNVKFFCNDTAGNMANSTTRYFSVNTTPSLNISLNPSKSWWNDLINASGAILASGQSLSDITVTIELNNKIKCTDQTDSNGLWTCTFNAPNELGSYTVKANITLSGNSTSATTTLKVAPSWGHVFSGVANRFAHQVPILIQEPSGRIHWVWVTVVVGIA